MSGSKGTATKNIGRTTSLPGANVTDGAGELVAGPSAALARAIIPAVEKGGDTTCGRGTAAGVADADWAAEPGAVPPGERSDRAATVTTNI